MVDFQSKQSFSQSHLLDTSFQKKIRFVVPELFLNVMKHTLYNFFWRAPLIQDQIISKNQSGEDFDQLHICHHHSRVASGKSISASLFQRNSCKGQFSLISRYLQLLNSVFTDLTKVFLHNTAPLLCTAADFVHNLIRHSHQNNAIFLYTEFVDCKL